MSDTNGALSAHLEEISCLPVLPRIEIRNETSAPIESSAPSLNIDCLAFLASPSSKTTPAPLTQPEFRTKQRVEGFSGAAGADETPARMRVSASDGRLNGEVAIASVPPALPWGGVAAPRLEIKAVSKPTPKSWYKQKPPPKRGTWHDRTVIAKASPLVKGSRVTVSFAAKEWKVSSRRIRHLLAAQRLQGRRLENGRWEVFYPYRFLIGSRGPVLRRQQASRRGRPKSNGEGR